MINANHTFKPADRKRISERVAALETQTDAEVVCAVATESGRYDRAESLWGILFSLTALVCGNKYASSGGWDGADHVSAGLQVVLVAGGFIVGSLVASYCHGMRRLLASRREMEQEVRRSVHQVFSEHGIGNTLHRGGILIYLSLFERILEIRCDHAVAGKISAADLQLIRDAVLEKIRQGDPASGLLAGLDCAQDILAKAIPASGINNDPLHNQLLLFHPRP